MDGFERSLGPERRFATTRWSLVAEAGRRGDTSAQQALAELCQAYWFPIYSYVRRQVPNAEEAKDLTQGFFEYLLSKDTVAHADPAKGRFRAFLLTVCKRYLANHWEKMKSQKRGGRHTLLSLDWQKGESMYAELAVDRNTPERMFDQQWAITLLGNVLDRLRDEYARRGKAAQFDGLKTFLSGAQATNERTLAAAAEELGMSPGAVKVAAHRMRVRYGQLLQETIALTVDSPEDVQEEIQNLFSILSS